MKVLVIAEQLRREVPGGVGTYVRGLLVGLDRLGDASVDISLWASRAPGHGSAAADPLASFGPLRTSVLPSTVLTRAWDLGLVRAGSGVDVVHATSLLTPGVGRAPRSPGSPATAPLTVFVHDLAWRALPDGVPARGARWHDAALGRARRRAARLLVPSTSTADALLHDGVPAGDIVVVTEGCDHLALYPRIDGGYLLSVSTLEPRKNLDRLIAAYGRARPHLRDPLPLKIVGPRGWTDRRGRTPVPSELPEGVELVGPVDDDTLARLLAGARALLYVPMLEGWGLPAVEAMRAGCPVVASPMPSAGDAALTVDAMDVGNIERGIITVVNDEARRDDLVSAGLERTAGFTWAAAARAHLDVWAACGR